MSGPLSDTPQQERERLAKLLAATAVSEVPNVVRSIAADNKTVFGAILRGELPARVLYEDDEVLCFRDIRPVSEHHSLVIPKLRLIENVGHCSPDDQALLEHMVAVAEKVVAAQYPGVDMQVRRAPMHFRWASTVGPCCRSATCTFTAYTRCHATNSGTDGCTRKIMARSTSLLRARSRGCKSKARRPHEMMDPVVGSCDLTDVAVRVCVGLSDYRAL